MTCSYRRRYGNSWCATLLVVCRDGNIFLMQLGAACKALAVCRMKLRIRASINARSNHLNAVNELDVVTEPRGVVHLTFEENSGNLLQNEDNQC